jgi:hypothetical protein
LLYFCFVFTGLNKEIQESGSGTFNFDGMTTVHNPGKAVT